MYIHTYLDNFEQASLAFFSDIFFFTFLGFFFKICEKKICDGCDVSRRSTYDSIHHGSGARDPLVRRVLRAERCVGRIAGRAATPTILDDGRGES